MHQIAARWKINSVRLLQCTAETGLLTRYKIQDTMLVAFSGGPFSVISLIYILNEGSKNTEEQFENPNCLPVKRLTLLFPGEGPTIVTKVLSFAKWF